MREVFRVIFYLPHDHPDIALGVSHAIDSYMHAVGEGPRTISHAHINHSEGAPLTAARWGEVRRVLLNTRRRSYPDDFSDMAQWEIEKRGFERGILFTGGFGIRNGYELEYKARIPWRPAPEETLVSLLTATLPIEYLEEHGPARVRQLALDMASKLLFASGHAGLALRLYWWLPHTDNAFRFETLRYPGIDLREAWSHEEWMGFRVDGVHWLNFLGPPIVTQLGGVSALRSRLRSAETTVVELGEERVVVSLGERPEVGDLATGKTLPVYRELARVLEPWLEPLFLKPRWAPVEGPRYTSLLLTEDEARHWWRRFLD
ncbi:type VI immunity family protein [Archangium sp.]|uniref:type VI immunity family protein n=1 Tax=Archangium sp. TaxID=1872627 RepID=UPI002D32E048|nr:type VI immunity family protein [Archangium sp.]HYO56213.1 type VI immunity family protein [Archangium sp.]